MIWNQRQLRRVLTEYLRHYNTARPHRRRGLRRPARRKRHRRQHCRGHEADAGPATVTTCRDQNAANHGRTRRADRNRELKPFNQLDVPSPALIIRLLDAVRIH